MTLIQCDVARKKPATNWRVYLTVTMLLKRHRNLTVSGSGFR
jgi:hypothetical protein